MARKGETPRVDGGKNSPSRVEFPAPPVLQPSNEEPEDLSNPKGPLPTQQTASPATPEVQVTTSPNAIADEGTAKGPSKPEEHNPREAPPPPRRRARSSSYPEKDPKKKEEKFQLPREGPGPKAPSQVANRSGETKSKPASPPRTLKLMTPQRPHTRSGTPHLTQPGLPDRRRQRSADGSS